MQLLTSAIHSGEPQEFIEYLDSILDEGSDSYDGLKELESLKEIRSFQGKGG